MRYRFAELEFDAESGRLTRAGVELQAQPKVIELLRYFLDHPGVLVPRDAVLAAVWGAHVSESALGQTLRKLRATLGDDEDVPRFVETVPRRGFRFLPDVRALRAENDPRLTTLLEAVRRHAVVTLLGTRGSGRKTLAARLDTRRVEVGAAETLLGAVARVFGVPEAPGDVRAALVAEPLPVLIIGACAGDIRSALGEWLTPERLVVVLGEALGVAAECVVHVPPLTMEEAVALYQEEARRGGAPPSSAAAVSALVGHLDHHPGAIQLAGARALVLPAETLLGRLDRRFELLPGLAALAADGWSALSSEDQRALLAVSVFEAAFSLVDAEAVAQPGDGWIGSALERLAANGLVLPRPPGLLVRENLRRWLELDHGDVLAAARSRLASHLLPRLTPLLAQLERRPDPDGVAALRRWLPELCAIGTPTARELVAGFHELLGEVGAGLEVLRRADTPELLLRQATLFARARRVPEARASLEAACAAGADGPARVRVEAIVLGARAETGEGGLSEEALALHVRAIGEGPRVRAATATTVAVVHRRAGRAAAAQDALRATAAALPSDAELARAVLIANIGIGHLHAGEPGAAVELLELAARDYAGFGLGVQETLVRLNLAAALLDDGRADDAEGVLAEVEAALIRAGHLGVAEVARGNRGTAALLSGRLDDADQHFRALLDASGTSSRRDAFACWGLATTARFANKSTAAATWIDRGLALADVPPRHRGLLLAARAGLEAEAGSVERGRAAWRALAELAASGDEALLPALVQVLDALLARAEGETRRAPPGPRYAELLLELGRLRRAQRLITA